MAIAPLMPKATAVWLVENTALSFDQIAQFCNLHPLEVKAIADGDAAQGIKGLDPILTGQLTREEIADAEADPELPAAHRRAQGPPARGQAEKGPALHAGVAPPGPAERHPLAGAQPSRSSRTARSCGSSAPPRSTIEAIRERTHWNSANLTPLDPVTLGLCSQIDLDLEVQRAAKEKPVAGPEAQGATLAARVRHHRAEGRAEAEPSTAAAKKSDELNVEAVFAKLKQIGGKGE